MIGRRLSAYEVLAELGSGGMGTVYLARAVEPASGLAAGTRVALKVIHAHLLGQPGFFKRFLREAHIGRQVHDENVVRTHDCDATEADGKTVHFLVMEYVEGQTLRELLAELHRVPEELCRHIGHEIAKGLTAIHAAGVVHRDLKPENVIITDDHVVKVMDLGVARLKDEAIRLSQSGAFVGSLDYAAPEQFHSGATEPDGRADLYALGVLLYELATGEHPYREDDPARVLRAILDEMPWKAGALNPELTPFFEEIVHALLAKDREARVASAADLATILEEGERSDWWTERGAVERSGPPSPTRRIRVGRETALYGRDTDLATLNTAYRKAARGDGQVLLVQGEAGIGKTRVVDEFVMRLRAADEDVHFLFGAYPPGGAATPARAFVEAYREHFGPEGIERTLGAYLKATPSLIPAFAALLRGESAPSGATALNKDSLHTVFVHATRALAKERTTIVMIDDLHFGPEEGRALFTSLAMAVPDQRVLLIGTMRPGVPERWIANVERLDHASLMLLSRLGPKDLFLLLSDSFRSDRLARELGMQIGLKCDGNPFFAFEIVRGLREGGFITEQPDGAYVTTRVIDEIRVPSSVMDLIQARIAELEDEDRNLLDVAACYGFEFDASLVGEALGMSLIPTLQRFGRIENRHGLVRSAGREHTFDHYQIQEVLYDGLNEQLREAYHQALAEALGGRHAGRESENGDELPGEVCVKVCEQFLRSSRPEAALPHLSAALDHLERRFLNEWAVALADRALERPGVLSGRRRLEILLRKNGRLQLGGRREEQAAVLGEALDLARAEGDKALLAVVEGAVGRLRWLTGSSTQAHEHFERSLGLARQAGDWRAEIQATADVGLMHVRLGRYEEARAMYERQLDLASEHGDARAEGMAISNLGATLSRLRRWGEAQERFRAGIALAQRIEDHQLEAYPTAALGNLLWHLGRVDEARPFMERALALARETGDRNAEANALLGLANLMLASERFEAALAHYEKSVALARAIGDRELEALGIGNLGHLLWLLGRHEAAREHGERHLALGREVGAPAVEMLALHNLALAHLEAGHEQDALRLAKEAEALLQKIGDSSQAGPLTIQLAEIRSRAGDEPGAVEAIEQAVDMSRRHGNAVELAHALAVRACLPGGCADAAERAFEDAGAGADTPEVCFHLWQATGQRRFLERANALLERRIEHAPADDHRAMRENVWLNREILAAWSGRGGEAGT